MEKSQRECKHLICMLAHDLVNNLSVIICCCDLLTDPGRADAEGQKHVQLIRETAKSMADRLSHQKCHIASIAQRVATQKETFID